MFGWVSCPSVYTARRLYILLLCGKHPPEQEDAGRPQEMLFKVTDAATFNRISHQCSVTPPKRSLLLGLWAGCSGPYADANYSKADGRPVYSFVSCCDQIWKQDSLPKQQGHISTVKTLKLLSYWQDDCSWALAAPSNVKRRHPLQQTDGSPSQVPFLSLEEAHIVMFLLERELTLNY